MDELLSPEIERCGDLAPSEAADLVNSWADLHGFHGYHEHARALDALSRQVAAQERPIQCMVLRHPALYSVPVASFVVLPRRYSL